MTKLVWEGSFFDSHSLALVNRELCTELNGAPGLELALRAAEPPPAEAAGDARLAALARLARRETAAPDVVVRHAWPLNPHPPERGKWVIMQPWEFGALPRHWYEPMKFGADEVWVYSSYNRQCYLEAGIPAEKVHVVPLGVHPELLTPPHPFPLRTRKRFKFLFVGGTILRKGIDVLLDAYVRAFSARDDVCLVIKDYCSDSFYRGQGHGAFIRELQSEPGRPEIEYLDAELSPAQLRDLYHACDCLVHPYRGEGFGLPIAEAMACGLPVIVPDRGGAADFCTPETAVLLPSRRVAVPAQLVGTLDTLGTPWWLEVRSADLQERLRAVSASPDAYAQLAARGRARVRAELTWTAAAERVRERCAPLPAPPRRQLRDDAAAQHALRMADGVAAWERGQVDAALRHFALAAERRRDADVLFNLGSVLLSRGDAATAVPLFEALLPRLRGGAAEDVALLRELEASLPAWHDQARPPRPDAAAPVPVRWYAPLFNASGYASESRAFLEGVLEDPRWRLQLVPQDPVGNHAQIAPELFERMSRHVRSLEESPVLEFQHGPAHACTAPTAPVSVCRTMLETDRIPPFWVEICNRFTEVWVATEFNRETFAASGVLRDKLRVVPGSIDTAVYDPARYARHPIPGAHGFAFLSVFDFTPRKGWELLLRAFCEEFTRADEVSLVLKVTQFFRGTESARRRVDEYLRANGYGSAAPIVVIEEPYSDEQMRQLYASIDAFVLPSRGEGWGRPYMEAMAMGRPTIGTRWSGNLEFMHDDNSYLVDVEALEACERAWPEMPLYHGHRWALPSLDSLRAQMRAVAEDRPGATARAARARADIVRDYDRRVVGVSFDRELERLVSPIESVTDDGAPPRPSDPLADCEHLDSTFNRSVLHDPA